MVLRKRSLIRTALVAVNVLEGTLDVSARGEESALKGPLELLVRTPQARVVRFPVAIHLRNHVVSAESVPSAQSGGSMIVVPVLSDAAVAAVSDRRAEALVEIDRSVDVTNVPIVVSDVVTGERVQVVNGSTTDETARLVSVGHVTRTGQRMRGGMLDLKRAVASGEIVHMVAQTIVSTVVRSEETTASAGDPPSITLVKGTLLEGNRATVSRGLRDQT
jgi:hypothetical protein